MRVRPSGRSDTRPGSIRRSPGRAGVAVITLATSVALVLGPAHASAADPTPPNPTDQQLADAAGQKDALANQVGTLSARAAQLKSQIAQMNLKAELAEQKVADALTKLQQAKASAAAAKKQVAAAQTQVDKARAEFSQYVHDTYMSSPVSGMAGGLLTAPDPTALLDRSAYENYVADNQVSALGDLDRATLAKSNADAAARLTVANQTRLTQGAEQALADAKTEVANAQAVSTQLNGQLASTQQQLQDAQANLASLNNQRDTYNAWVAEQARLAAERKAAEQAAAQRAAQAAAQRAEAQRAAQAAAAATSSRSSSVVSVQTAPSSPAPSAPSGGSWSSSAGQTAVNRAMAYLDWPYSFAAGNYSGPTYGIAVDYDSRNDGGIYGFDCSGLTLYAWAPYLHMDHYAATQFWQAGSVHPSMSQLQPGDLVFWSSDGTQAGIGHVALYIGNGNVIQAPHSGAYIEITPVNQVEDGYYGATRPLT